MAQKMATQLSWYFVAATCIFPAPVLDIIDGGASNKKIRIHFRAFFTTQQQGNGLGLCCAANFVWPMHYYLRSPAGELFSFTIFPYPIAALAGKIKLTKAI
jgi:hypothetical protein